MSNFFHCRELGKKRAAYKGVAPVGQHSTLDCRLYGFTTFSPLIHQVDNRH